MTELDTRILEEAKALQPQLISLRRTIHQHAEVGFALENTHKLVFETLTAMGYTPVKCGKCGILATIEPSNSLAGGRREKNLLLRADMDALPITEQTGLEYACPSGTMHACGHDLHTVALLGAAALLMWNKEALKCRVTLMFQPSEETFEGAKDMIASGALDPKPDAAVMMHVVTGIPFQTGTLLVPKCAVSSPAADYFTITVHGKSCHGSMPEQGVDANLAAAQILIGLQEIIARELSISQDAVLTIGRMTGGTAGNVIAETAELEGTLRTYDEEVRAKIKARMQEIAVSLAAAYRATAAVIFTSGCPTVQNDMALAELAAETATDVLGQKKVIRTDRGSGSEDFAYVTHQVPSVMLNIAAGNYAKGYVYPQHHPKAQFDEKVIAASAAYFAQFAIRWGYSNP